MNRAKFMGSKSLLEALRYAIGAELVIPTKKLWELVQTWNSKTSVFEFEGALDVLLGEGYRCTIKVWYPVGAKIDKKPYVPKTDPRQTRMFE